MLENVKYINRTLELALMAQGRTSPNPMVGAVIVKNGRVLAEGFHSRAGSDHAEVVALKKLKNSAKGATLYVNLEPCFHFGRTPPCVDAVIKSGIKEVVIAMKDPNPKVSGRSIRKLRAHGIKVVDGVLKEKAQALNEVFVKYITQKRPFVVAKSAQTLDGKIAAADGDSKWITSEKTRAFARLKRNDFDAILVGINTVLKDNPRLDAPGKKIKKVILDRLLKINPKARLFKNTLPENCILAVTKKADQNKMSLFIKRGCQVIICPEKDSGVDLNFLLKKLAEKEISSILMEGGARTIGSALRQGLVDKMHIYIAPKIIGDEKALNSVVGLNIKGIKQSLKLDISEIKKINQDIFIKVYVYRNR